jgi:hypothetical protein
MARGYQEIKTSTVCLKRLEAETARKLTGSRRQHALLALPRREPRQEAGLALADFPVVEVLGVAEGVVVEAAGAEDVRPVVPARQGHPPEPAPQRRQVELAPAGCDGRARAAVRVLHGCFR